MGFIHVPDEHPGRCKNYRSVTHADGFVESLRCMDYDTVPHQCAFPRSNHITLSLTGMGGQSSVYTVPKPVPWKKPADTDIYESALRPESFDTTDDDGNELSVRSSSTESNKP